MIHRLKRVIPKSFKSILKQLFFMPGDIIDKFTKRDSMIPPRSMIFIGKGDFLKIGEGFKQHFIELGNLQPNHRVLDVGCGIGRMAIPLTNYLSMEGEYWGFDIVKKGIEWCQKRVSPKFNNFHFLHSDVYNKHYNPNGKILAQDYQFPFEDGFFDFVFLTSVFTHMLPKDTENYMGEISRVLKVGGKSMITFFILNEEVNHFIRLGRSALDFRFAMDGFTTTDKNTPEDAIALDENFVTNLYEKHKLKIIQPILYGSWSGRKDFFTYQDVIIADK